MEKDVEQKRETCKDRWAKHKRSRVRDIRAILKREAKGDSEESIFDYGLSFDYVAPDTFDRQKRGYWRWLISWGGPSDEFRFYGGGPDEQVERVEYRFMDWFDGYGRTLRGKDEALLLDCFSRFDDVDAVASEYRKALTDAE